MYKTELEIKIPFYDVDVMNIVWHGNYIKYLEQARCDLFEKLGYTYMDMKNDGYTYPIAKMSTKYIRPVSFDEIIVVKTHLKEIEPAIIMDYVIYSKKTKEKIFKAKSLMIGVDIATKKSIYKAPFRLIKALENKK
ncbi:acyl-CoA thioesterase [bacterium]|nr:acyl-CoA thioesterase [bacterium]